MNYIDISCLVGVCVLNSNNMTAKGNNDSQIVIAHAGYSNIYLYAELQTDYNRDILKENF